MALVDSLRHPLLAVAEPVSALLERIGQARGKVNPAKAAGQTGERLAWFHIRRLGYTVVARQWRAPNLNGEIDLIAWHNQTLCFIEVKTRRTSDAFASRYTINPKKADALRRMAGAYIQGLPWLGGQSPDPHTRFESISVDLSGKRPIIEHQKRIF